MYKVTTVPSPNLRNRWNKDDGGGDDGEDGRSMEDGRNDGVAIDFSPFANRVSCKFPNDVLVEDVKVILGLLEMLSSSTPLLFELAIFLPLNSDEINFAFAFGDPSLSKVMSDGLVDGGLMD